MRYNRSRADQRAFSDGNAAENDSTTPDRSATLNSGWHYFPVFLCLETSIGSRPGIQIVDEHDAMSNKNIILDRDSFADECMRRDLAAPPDDGVFLHLDKRSHLGFVTDCAAVEVNQIWLEDLDPVPQDNVGRNWHEHHCIRHFSPCRKCRAQQVAAP